MQEYDYSYRTATLQVTAVDKPQMDQFAPAPAQTTLGELMEILDVIRAKSLMLQGTSHAESSHMRLAPRTPQSYICILSPEPEVLPNSSLIKQSKPDKPVNFHP